MTGVGLRKTGEEFTSEPACSWLDCDAEFGDHKIFGPWMGCNHPFAEDFERHDPLNHPLKSRTVKIGRPGAQKFGSPKSWSLGNGAMTQIKPTGRYQ